MFSFLFGTPAPGQEIDPVHEAATITLMGRVDTMLEKQTLHKTRFAKLESYQ